MHASGILISMDIKCETMVKNLPPFIPVLILFLTQKLVSSNRR